MPEKAQPIMNNENNVLPNDFDGVFRFTNFTDQDFSAKWGGIEYTFPAMKTSPMIIPGATPEEVQSIRKKFAKELAIKEFYKTPKFIGMDTIVPGGIPALYTESDLVPFIQRCLEPLPLARVIAKNIPKDSEKNYTKDSKTGKNVTKVLDDGESLLSQGSGSLE